VGATSPAARIGPPGGLAASPGLRWSAAGLVAASWVSAASFGLYILAFYLGAIPAGHMELWNQNLPGLYAKGDTVSWLAMAAHLATGAVILLLGPVQLIGAIRCRWPRVHRYLGRVYVFTSGVAGLGGLGFIVSKGTIGGSVMNAGFGLYGALMVWAAVATYRYARARRFDEHCAWALRLFALAIGSWLYRMDYGFWLIAAHRIGHTSNFHGPFDMVMCFFFYLPNLALVELFLRSRGKALRPALRLSTGVLLNAATAFVAVGTYYFLRYYWGASILHGLLGMG